MFGYLIGQKTGKLSAFTIHSVKKWSASAFTFFIISLYTLVISASIQPLNCILQSDGTYLMGRNPSEFCYTDEWYSSIGGVIFFIFVYAGIFPICLAIFYWKNNKNLDSIEFISQFEVLMKPYRRGCYWWEIVVMIRKAAFVAVLDFLDLGESRFTVYYIALCTLFLFLWIDIAVSPYATREFNKFSLTYDL